MPKSISDDNDFVVTNMLDHIATNLEKQRNHPKAPEGSSTERMRWSLLRTNNVLCALLILRLIVAGTTRSLKKGQEAVSTYIGNLRDLIEKVPEEDIRAKLEKKIEALETESQRLHQQIQEIKQEQNKEQLNAKVEIDKLTAKSAAFERHSRVWQSFLEREVVATIVGGCLLIIITLFLIVANLVHVMPSDILNNSFLVILGYFFGQSVSRAASRTRKENK